jgi:hypothetical protein
MPSDAPLPFLLLGAGERARAWWSAAAQVPRLVPVGHVTRGGARIDGLDVPHFASLDAALETHPAALVLAALPPRAAFATARKLSVFRRRGLVEGPLEPGADVAPGPHDREVQVAHGWTTLSGRAWLERVLRAHAPLEVTLEVRGLPERPEGDLTEVVTHALALLRRLFPGLKPVEARQPADGVLDARFFTPGGAALRLRALTRGHALDLQFRGHSAQGSWRWAPHEETVLLRGRAGDDAPLQRRPAPPPELRALRQLLDPATARGDTLADALELATLARALWARLPGPPAISSRRLRHALSLAERRPDDVEAQLGLERVGPAAPASPAPGRFTVEIPAGHLELWPFLAGLKPVCFLTTRPERVATELARFGDVHVERRERLVEVGPQDSWNDRRDVGEPWVELYVSRDPALARRAAHVQAETDPTKAIREMGALLGYPPCCTEAFATQDDRSNNSRNRYVSAARTPPGGSWPWELNNLVAMLVPFFPCHYGCSLALDWARRTLAAMAADHPAVVAALEATLARPTLYFDHERLLAFDGAATTEAPGRVRVAYRAVHAGPEAPPAFVRWAALFTAGDAFTLDEEGLEITRAMEPVATFRRTDPALGFIAPFAAVR